jgi:UDP-hydrolysing UDP-N-acetyl-D-glucosamine 2-epimerase
MLPGLERRLTPRYRSSIAVQYQRTERMGDKVTLRVSVVSGSRADFGPLQPLMTALRDDNRFQFTTIVCAVAGAEETERQLRAFAEVRLPVGAAVTWPESSQSSPEASSVAGQAGRALAGVAEALRELRPDLVVLLGDRFEIMAAAVAAHLQRTPIVHLSGGDETLGSLDDAMRHAISRLAALHLPTSDESARRLRALGIPRDRITVVGSTALDALLAFAPMSREKLEKVLGVDFGERLIAVTYHPATQAEEPPAKTFRNVVLGIRDAAPEATIVMTSSNADEGGAAINRAARAISASDRRFVIVPSLGSARYWSLLHHVDVVVGNSSSALIEAPAIGVPVVDVGERQASRLRAKSCIHVPAERSAIAEGVARALARGPCPEPSPYGDGCAVPRILELLAGIQDPAGLLTPRPLIPAER